MKETKLAIISDIHGNIPALERVMTDIRSRGIERIICLGDTAGKGPGSAEAVDIVCGACELSIKGNWDVMLTEHEMPMLSWHQKELGPERLEYLKSLPVYIEFMMSGKLVRLCHASPHDVWHRTYLSSEMKDRLKLFDPVGSSAVSADVVGYGDIHGAHVDHFDGKTVFNTGSVGNPLEITQASYAIIEGVYNSLEPAPFLISLARIPYDIEKAVLQTEESSMPEEDKKDFIDELKTAVYRKARRKR